MLRCQADRCDRDSSSHLHRVSYREKFKMTLCGKHNYQMERGGVIKEQSRYDKNKIEVVDNYAKVYCNNKYGEIIDFFIIDIEDIDKVSRYKWFIRSDGRVVSNTAKDKFEMFREDLEKIGAGDLHELMRAWEIMMQKQI